MKQAIFELLILIGRPAAGKSEIIDYLQRLPAEERRQRFHLGDLHIIDDFPMIWTWFEEDYILSKILDQPRLHTDSEGFFLHNYQWDLLIRRLGMEFEKFRRDQSENMRDHTVIIEFSRGTEHGGYQAAFSNLSPEIMNRAAVLYVSVPFEESLRKNELRFNPERPDSILEHSLPEKKLRRLYAEDDWSTLSSPDPNYLLLESEQIPYVSFENRDDVTTGPPGPLGERLEGDLDHLWRLHYSRKAAA